MVEVKLHDIGEGMTEGEILHYFVKEGDRVKDDQPLVEVQTDKMTAELPSPATGIVKEIKVSPGQNVSVGTTLLIIDGDKEDQPTEQKQLQTKEKLVLAAPYTRKIARELGVKIEDVIGTGAAGRITDEDIYRFAKAKPIAESNKQEKIVDKQSEQNEEIIPFKGRRKQIAAKMTKSMFTIPHVTHFEEVDVTNVLELITQLKQSAERISASAFFIKATQLTLKEYPIFNAILDEENEIIRLKKEFHIGIATDSDEGLIVPVIHHVEKKSIKEVNQEMKDLIKKAKENKLSGKDLSNGTFTISNVGPLGSVAATPIINYPESALLAFHKAKKRPAVVNDEMAIRSIMNVSMSFDHRIADGAQAIAFTNRLTEFIENPSRMLLELI
ncbi:dihydrolipoamide acetyltransferase family protein [Bacillus sp. FJAT-50079]|uniref:dihydrolipoamide acetyltransferase family protein n=1 Tax=Bacillus sp. FJAT-50079 TaxID=2833577 RepID=UPI001BC8CBAA|nr:dihydrolipoamide acetyltransferase family protein [Bacillus sp. FJAT-50079]MBS4210742.1 2-oxo acid dehydrogenase subunit E2 [Bacillus sp. FJAT-50079]